MLLALVAALGLHAGCGGSAAPGPVDIPDPGFLPGEWQTISLGTEYACGLHSDGTVECWGRNDSGQARPPKEKFKSLSTSAYHSCGVTMAGEIVCWGLYAPTPPSGSSFVHASTGDFDVCANTTDGRLLCSAPEDSPRSSARFTDVDLGTMISCAIDTSGEAACWPSFAGSRTSSLGPATNVSAGGARACGVRPDHGLFCVDGFGSPAIEIEGRFQQVSVGRNDERCAVQDDGSVICWTSTGVLSPVSPANTFRMIQVGEQAPPSIGGCGITSDGSAAACWGAEAELLALRGVQFTAIDAGASGLACGITSAGMPLCWSAGGMLKTPEVAVETISVGVLFCGLTTDGTPLCWNVLGTIQPVPADTFKQISAGGQHACGVRSDDTVVCWGDNFSGQLNVPAEPFVRVAAGGFQTCAIRPDQSVACWGGGRSAIASPTGSFVALDAGVGAITCGVHADGTIACWDLDGIRAETPAGTFKQIAVAGEHACAIAPDDSVVCWAMLLGGGGPGDVAPPPGPFLQVAAGAQSAGPGFACGIKTDQTVSCWGTMVR